MQATVRAMDVPGVYAGIAYLLRSMLRFTYLRRRGVTKAC
jgi:hypothetical protein